MCELSLCLTKAALSHQSVFCSTNLEQKKNFPFRIYGEQKFFDETVEN